MAVQNVLSVAVSGLLAQSSRAAEIANNVVNVNTAGFTSGEVLTIAVEAGDRGSGVLARRRQSDANDAGEGGGGDTDLARQFANLIETEVAYKANALVVRTAEATLGRFLDTVA
jgi:flagellar basal-body rod protein FlgC